MFWVQQKGMLAWIIAYAFALYNDFCGYTNIMQGISLLFGIELTSNFRQPFFARNFAEFWNRWHITLSHWLRDYIYFPVRRLVARWFPPSITIVHITIPPMITMLVSGLWHSRLETGVTHMLLWGGLHGAYQIGERLSAFWGQNQPSRERAVVYQVVAASSVFVLVTLAWIPFQVGVSASIASWMTMLNPDLLWANMPQVVWIVAASLGIDALQQKKATDLFFQKWSPRKKAFATAFLILVIFISIRGNRLDFVYAGF
jgi:D-alanyl-lipoteichoic acid acyltransferase DltB (MBOAT superfamily)